MRAARGAVLTCNGKFVVSGRASFVWETYLMRRVAGVPGDYAIRMHVPRDAPWHRLSWTMEEAEEYLREWGTFGSRRVRNALVTRAGRERRGLRVA